ncbi:hypothetical protein [Sphingomonas japonica]|uniref:Uncharacterized protein n=1 Tax=Sphingomonas japonica TaxID=511662 RepID=A0ABX0U2J9_9SPHN|nr:hypothetical protein [Sphingomonas japonica]NIJ24794.1 hypothetical protein [Sphingomonas japonica]
MNNRQHNAERKEGLGGALRLPRPSRKDNPVTNVNADTVIVEQCDREAAAEYLGTGGWGNDKEYVLKNMLDCHPLVQIVARHRIASTAPLLAEIEAKDARIAALELGVSIALAAPMIDHSSKRRGVYDVLSALLSPPHAQEAGK